MHDEEFNACACESESEFDWNAQSILGTAAIFTNLGTAVQAASAVCDGPVLGRTEVGTHLGTSMSSASQTYHQPAIRPVKADLSCNATRPIRSGARPTHLIYRYIYLQTMSSSVLPVGCKVAPSRRAVFKKWRQTEGVGSGTGLWRLLLTLQQQPPQTRRFSFLATRRVSRRSCLRRYNSR